MPHEIPWRVTVRQHPGSTDQDIHDEPDSAHSTHDHRIGYRNRQDRFPGLTHAEDAGELPDLNDGSASPVTGEELEREANAELNILRDKTKKGDLINFRDIITNKKDFHLRYPANCSIGWRYVLDTTEDWVENVEDWPANVKSRKKEEQEKQKRRYHPADGVEVDGTEDSETRDGGTHEETDWQKRESKNNKHNDAYAANGEQLDNEQPQTNGETKSKSGYERLLERYTPQEIELLRNLEHEKEYRKSFKQNDGKRNSPQTKNRTTVLIDEQDQFSPDNWLPRSDKLIRLTGKHPLNAEADLTALFEGSLITPNELHYVKTHGTVPRLLWEFHRLDIEVDEKKLTLSMDELKHDFEAINIPVSLACDGNRRKELNMIKKSKGFNWGSGATGCVYWKGPLLRDVLLAAGVAEGKPTSESKQRWVNFQGADEPSEGKYETCIPLDYAMDPQNDVVLPYEMNDLPLPPDHSYRVRLLIPGYVGGRCVKWLKKI